MDFDMRKLSPHALDACTGDLLAVVKLQSLQASAVLQVLQRGVRDKKAVVQLQHPESLVPTGAAAQVQDPLICDELTVGQAQGLQLGTVDGELDEGAVGNLERDTVSVAPALGLNTRSWILLSVGQDTFFKVHLLQLMAIPS